MPTATLLTQGNSTVNGTTFTTASVDPADNALVLAFIYHIDTVSPVDPGVSIAGNGASWSPVATVNLDMSEASKEHRLTCWKALMGTYTAGTIVFTYTNTQTAGLWAIVEITSTDRTLIGAGSGTNPHGISAIRQVAIKGSSNGTAATLLPTPLLAARSPGNTVVAAFAHAVNEATTPGTGMTELADQANADGALEVSWSNAAYTSRPSASWATSTALYGAIAVEVAAPNNEIFYVDPVGLLYQGV